MTGLYVVYKSSSECYRKVMSEGRLDDCNSQWIQLGHVLKNVSAYEFYCQLNDTKRRQLIASVYYYYSTMWRGGTTSEAFGLAISRSRYPPSLK